MLVLLGVVVALVGQSAAEQRAWEVSPVLAVSDVQPVHIGVQLRVPVLDDLDVTAELGVAAGRGSQYLGEAFVGVRTDGPVWFGVDGGVALVQALTKGASGVGKVSLVEFETDLLSQLRGRVGVQVLERFAPFVGVTLNYQVSFAPNEMLTPSFFPVPLVLGDRSAGGGHQLWPGLVAGVVF
jgi:hypothetical protein